MKRFYDKVKQMPSGCQEWQGAYRGKYGAIKISGKVQSTHRVAYEFSYGVFDKSLFVCHTCDNPKCVNPDHLFLGTHSDNMKDAYSKGRLTLSPNRSLDDEKVEQVKKAIATKGQKSLRVIAENLGISHAIVKSISQGKNYC